MTSKTKLQDHLADHLPYELAMLRYTRDQLTRPHGQLDWNAYFESFIVHGRNLYHFLTSDDDARNMKADDYETAYLPIEKERQKLQGTLIKLHEQVLHLAKRRPTDPREKFNRTHAEKLQAWIEDEMKRFLDCLNSDYRQCWDADRADPKCWAPTVPALRTTSSSGEVVGYVLTGPSAVPKP
jgi:hypothetical protein